MGLEFRSLHIEKQMWGKDEGKFTGSITFANSEVASTVRLSPERSHQMLSIVADQLVENAHELGAALLGSIAGPEKLIERPTDAAL